MINYVCLRKEYNFLYNMYALIINLITATRTLLPFCVRINLLASSPTFSHSSDIAVGVRLA